MESQSLPASSNISVPETHAAPSSPSHSPLPSLAASTASFLTANQNKTSSTPKTQSLPPIIPPQGPKFAGLTPQTQLTGTAALANKRSPKTLKKMTDEKKEKPEQAEKVDNPTTPNPAMVLSNFQQMSRPRDGPPQDNSAVSQKLSGLPSIATAANAMDTSGSSPSTATTTMSGTAEVSGSEGGTTTATAGPNNPADTVSLQPGEQNTQYQAIAAHQPPRTNSISEALSATTPTTPGFGPNATTPTTPYSPNATTPGGTRGKHTCPHCHQTFTRHHNLKSHLLTHSHEKPFLCQTCQARFRRLHDLKRHSKLHTGERPHMCNKCGRKFARGDALARHARAEGGCAGRRSSMAGMMEDGSMGPMGSGDNDDGMEGLDGLIEGDPDGDVDMIGSEEGPRRRSLPSIRTDFSHGTQNSQGQITPSSSGYSVQGTHHHPTYPPLNTPNRTASTAGPSPGGSGLFPPQHLLKGNATASATPLQTSALSAGSSATPTSGGGGNILSGVITDSPRPTSPAAMAQGHRDSGSSDGRDNSLNNALINALHMPQQSRESAPTAHMSGGQANNIFALGNLDNFVSHIRTLEDKIRTLAEQNKAQDEKIRGQDDKIRSLADEIRDLKSAVKQGEQKQLASPQQVSPQTAKQTATL